jgi:hypothetical protein
MEVGHYLFSFFTFPFAVHLEELQKVHEYFFMFVVFDRVAKILMKYDDEVTKKIFIL